MNTTYKETSKNFKEVSMNMTSNLLEITGDLHCLRGTPDFGLLVYDCEA